MAVATLQDVRQRMAAARVHRVDLRRGGAVSADMHDRQLAPQAPLDVDEPRGRRQLDLDAPAVLEDLLDRPRLLVDLELGRTAWTGADEQDACRHGTGPSL